MIETSAVKELIVNFVENVLPLSERETGRERDRERGRETETDRQTDRQTETESCNYFSFKHQFIFQIVEKYISPNHFYITLLCLRNL